MLMGAVSEAGRAGWHIAPSAARSGLFLKGYAYRGGPQEMNASLSHKNKNPKKLKNL